MIRGVMKISSSWLSFDPSRFWNSQPSSGILRDAGRLVHARLIHALAGRRQ